MTSNTNHQEIHERALRYAREYKRAESDLLTAIEAVDREKVYRAMGWASTFEYCVKELGLSESVSLNFIAVARKSREVPALSRKIQQGELSVSKARKILPVLTLKTQEKWIALASTASLRAIEKEVARENPKSAVTEKASYVNGTRIHLQLGVSEELMLRLRRLQDLESQRQKRPVALEEVLEKVTHEYQERHDPLNKAKRAVVRNESQTERGPAPAHENLHKKKIQSMSRDIQKARRPLSAALKHRIMLKNQAQCAHIHEKTGIRCQQKRWLEIHHIQPVSQGGLDTIENLTLLCSSHHQAQHHVEHRTNL